jgi:hypothetical protein
VGVTVPTIRLGVNIEAARSRQCEVAPSLQKRLRMSGDVPRSMKTGVIAIVLATGSFYPRTRAAAHLRARDLITHVPLSLRPCTRASVC